MLTMETFLNRSQCQMLRIAADSVSGTIESRRIFCSSGEGITTFVAGDLGLLVVISSREASPLPAGMNQTCGRSSEEIVPIVGVRSERLLGEITSLRNSQFTVNRMVGIGRSPYPKILSAVINHLGIVPKFVPVIIESSDQIRFVFETSDLLVISLMFNTLTTPIDNIRSNLPAIYGRSPITLEL